nr:uncharacterized protein in chlN 3'region-like [Nerophis lumbriciformis]
MLHLEDHVYLAPFDNSFDVSSAPTSPSSEKTGKTLEKRLRKLTKKLDEQQRMLYAQDRYAVLLVFQALDAAGKDGTIRAVFNRADPAGVRVHPFKSPSSEELEHDFLWRTSKVLPRKGNFGVFNRSYYEEVLRYESIRHHEQHLAQCGTVVIKFWLKHSKDEQKARFMDRLNQPEKNWKFSDADVRERGFWDEYMTAYEDAINATARPWAPWYVIPADNKDYMRVQVAEIVTETLDQLDLHYPITSEERSTQLVGMKRQLESEK